MNILDDNYEFSLPSGAEATLQAHAVAQEEIFRTKRLKNPEYDNATHAGSYDLLQEAKKTNNTDILVTKSEEKKLKLPEHSHVGASSMKRVVYCPVSVFLSHDLEGKESKYASEGTIAHELAEIRLAEILEGKKFTPLEKLNEARKGKNEKPFNAEMDRHGKGYAEFCFSKVKSYMTAEHNFRYKIEAKLVGDLDRHMFGTVDFVFLYTDPTTKLTHLIVVDYKYGRGVEVEKEENFQTINYVYYGCEDLADYGPFEDAEMYIFQPRITKDELINDDSEDEEDDDEDSEEKVYPFKIKISTVYDQWLPIFRAAIDLANEWISQGHVPPEDMKKYQQLGPWCKFCKAKDGLCEAYSGERKDRLVQLFKKAVKHVPEKELKEPKVIQQAFKNGHFTAEELEFVALNKSKLANLLDGMSKAAKSIAERGGKFPNAKLIEETPSREWNAAEQVIAKKLIKLGFEKPLVTTTKLVGFSVVEKELGSKAIADLVRFKDSKSYKLVPRDHEKAEAKLGLDTAVMFKAASKAAKKFRAEQ
jgi:hypothetical protein